MTVTDPRQMNTTFAHAFNSRSLKALLALYEPDAVLRAATGDRDLAGIDAFTAELQGLLRVPGTMTSLNRFCLRHGDLALLSADWPPAARPSWSAGRPTARGFTSSTTRQALGQPRGRRSFRNRPEKRAGWGTGPFYAQHRRRNAGESRRRDAMIPTANGCRAADGRRRMNKGDNRSEQIDDRVTISFPNGTAKVTATSADPP